VKLNAPPIITRHAAAVMATATIGAAGTLLCAGCGGDDASEPLVQVVTLDADRLGSVDAMAGEAAAQRGAPGDAEPVLYRVRAASRHDAELAVAELKHRGFETVRLATDDMPRSAAR
jgi:hypothetical protein